MSPCTRAAPSFGYGLRALSSLTQQLRRTADELGKTIVIVLHDINFAGHYADYICTMNDGQVTNMGTPVTMLETAHGPLASYF